MGDLIDSFHYMDIGDVNVALSCSTPHIAGTSCQKGMTCPTTGQDLDNSIIVTFN